MAASEARIRANRENSAKSTGPKSAEGKAASRRNALKHGLTGSGVALPGEDEALVLRKFEELWEEFKPTRPSSAGLVRRIAHLTIRLERCERYDSASVGKRTREAVDGYEDDRLARVEALVDRLRFTDKSAARKLRAMPEGVEWMLDEWSKLREDLDHPDRPRWTEKHLERSRDLRGISPMTFRVSKERALMEALGGFFANLERADGEGLDDAARSEWARLELLEILDAEVARLRDALAAFDPEQIARERAEAVELALFDPSQAATLARKYEAATERALYKAMKEFREAEAGAEVAVESDPSPETGTISEELASILPEIAEDVPVVEKPRRVDPRKAREGLKEDRKPSRRGAKRAKTVPIGPV